MALTAQYHKAERINVWELTSTKGSQSINENFVKMEIISDTLMLAGYYVDEEGLVMNILVGLYTE